MSWRAALQPSSGDSDPCGLQEEERIWGNEADPLVEC